MLKGCKRNMIVLRGTGSDEFDAAYFIVKEGNEAKSEKSLIDEANRIVSENRRHKSGTQKRRVILSCALLLLAFAAGFFLAFLLF